MMDRQELVEKILEMELEMFMTVPAIGNPSCRESPDNFRTHRSAQFSAWSKPVLVSYLEDLKAAKASGRNLMTYKYARMDEIIPSENDSPLIDDITAAQKEWQLFMIRNYPGLMKNARGLTDNDDSMLDVSFERYLRAELESYSPETLELLMKDVSDYLEKGVNMSELIYLYLVKSMGFDSLESFK